MTEKSRSVSGLSETPSEDDDSIQMQESQAMRSSNISVSYAVTESQKHSSKPKLKSNLTKQLDGLKNVIDIRRPSKANFIRKRSQIGLHITELRKKRKEAPQEEEDNSYSCGSSESNDNFEQKYEFLETNQQKKQRLMYLWSLAYKKAKGASIIIQKLHDHNQKLFFFGFKDKTNLKFQEDPADLMLQRAELINKEKLQDAYGLILPTNSKKQIWDIFIMILLIYTAIFVPIKVAFIENSSNAMFVFDLMVDILFLSDIIVTFFSVAEDDRGNYITQRSEIAIRYLKGWFFIDFFTSIPFQIAEKLMDDPAVGGNTKMLRLLRIPRLYKLVKVVRLLKLVKLTNSSKMDKVVKILNFGGISIKIMQIMGVVFFINHLVACLWYGVARITDFPDDCWVILGEFKQNSVSLNYLISFYWSFQTLTTVGFGDISAHNSIERTVAIGCMIIGVGFYSYTIGNMTQMLESLDVDNQDLQEKLDTLAKFQTTQKIPNRLYYKIKRHLENSQMLKKYNETEKLLHTLPVFLREQVVSITHGEILKKIHFFKTQDQGFIISMLHELKPITFVMNDLIYQQGEVPLDIYFIQQGKVTLFSDLNDHITDERLLKSINKNDHLPKTCITAIIQYIEGGYFGDSDIFARGKQTNYSKGRDLTAICVNDDSIMFQMTLTQIQKIRDQYENVYKLMKDTALKKYKNHKLLINQKVKSHVFSLKVDNSDYSSFEEEEQVEPENKPPANFESEFSVIDYKEPETQKNQNIDINDEDYKARVKFLDRKAKFETQFEETILNFSMNVDFLNQQQVGVENLISRAQERTEKAIQKMVQMNENIMKANENMKETHAALADVRQKFKKKEWLKN